MVSRVKVKICDVRTPEIARVCAEVGVDYIGIHQIQGAFQPEKLDILQKIRQAAGQVKLVLVTKEDNLDILCGLCTNFEWDYVQLHFKTSKEFLEKFRCCMNDAGIHIGIIAFMNSEDIEPNYISEIEDLVDYFLFDSTNIGGKGIEASKAARQMIRSLNLPKKFFYAGGLNAGNVGAYIREIQPYAVDVQSGVQYKLDDWKHLKSPEKIKEFVKIVKEIDYRESNCSE